jgi:putative thioredoxin
MATDVTDATFQTAVIERSADVTVVIDLWAPWCGPCRTLGPVLEKVVDEAEGVELVKVNIDDNPQVAAAFRVQSIPAVCAVRDKAVVDGFIGALPEAQVREWVEQLATEPTEAEQLVARGDEASLRAALALEPDSPAAIVALAEMLVEQGNTDEALALLARIPETPETRRVAALARTGVVADADGFEQKLDDLLPRVKDDDAARQEYVDLLEVMGAGDPRTAEYRRKLSAALF